MKMNPGLNRFSLTAVGLVLGLLVLGCRDPKIDSKWPAEKIKIDGVNTEWKFSDLFYDEDNRVSIGICNDNDNIYVLLFSHDQRIKHMIMENGLTVWFDPEGGKKKGLGVHFPVGLPHYSRRPMMDRPPEEESGPPPTMLPDKEAELQLLGPEVNEQKTMLLADIEKYGLRVQAREVEGNFCYELSVPLRRNNWMKETPQTKYAVRTDLSKRISIGFETEKPVGDHRGGFSGKMEGGPGKPGGMPPGGGMGGGPPPGGSGPGPSGKRPDSAQSLELWVKVKPAVPTTH